MERVAPLARDTHAGPALRRNPSDAMRRLPCCARSGPSANPVSDRLVLRCVLTPGSCRPPISRCPTSQTPQIVPSGDRSCTCFQSTCYSADWIGLTRVDSAKCRGLVAETAAGNAAVARLPGPSRREQDHDPNAARPRERAERVLRRSTHRRGDCGLPRPPLDARAGPARDHQDAVRARGRKYSYSNSGYVLLGGVIEKMTRRGIERVFHAYRQAAPPPALDFQVPPRPLLLRPSVRGGRRAASRCVRAGHRRSRRTTGGPCGRTVAWHPRRRIWRASATACSGRGCAAENGQDAPAAQSPRSLPGARQAPVRRAHPARPQRAGMPAATASSGATRPAAGPSPSRRTVASRPCEHGPRWSTPTTTSSQARAAASRPGSGAPRAVRSP
jgi:hypothetical protein